MTTTNIDPSRLSPPAQRVLAAGAPLPARMLAAGGVVPGASAAEAVTVVAILTQAAEAEVAAKARDSIGKLPQPILTGALGADLEPGVVDLLADSYARDASVVERLLRMPRIGGEALALLADRADEKIGELIATNEQRLLQFPVVIEKLYMNKRVRMSTADRVLELAVRNDLELSIPAYKEAAQAIRNELIPEASPEPTFEDKLAAEVEQIAVAISKEGDVEDTHEVTDEGEEKVKEKILPLHARLAELTISQRIRRAMLGTGAERMLLVRDTNRLVAAAAIQSPMINENDVARISTSRQVSEDVLRIIARNKEWMRIYQIKLNLVMNPRTPVSFVSRMIPQLQDHDVKSLSKSKNVPASVQQLARQHLSRKQSGKK